MHICVAPLKKFSLFLKLKGDLKGPQAKKHHLQEALHGVVLLFYVLLSYTTVDPLRSELGDSENT